MAFIIDDILGGVMRHQDLMKLRARPRFETTEYGKYLQGIGQKGSIDVAQRLTGYAGDVSNRAANETAAMQGRMIKSNMAGSIATQRTLAQPGMQAAELIGRERSNLESMNDETRQRAQQAYAQSAGQWDEQRRLEQEKINQMRRDNSTGALISAGTSALGLAAGGALGYMSGAAGAAQGIAGQTAIKGMFGGAAKAAIGGLPAIAGMVNEQFKTPEQQRAIDIAKDEQGMKIKEYQSGIDYKNALTKDMEMKTNYLHSKMNSMMNLDEQNALKENAQLAGLSAAQQYAKENPKATPSQKRDALMQAYLKYLEDNLGGQQSIEYQSSPMQMTEQVQ